MLLYNNNNNNNDDDDNNNDNNYNNNNVYNYTQVSIPMYARFHGVMFRTFSGLWIICLKKQLRQQLDKNPTEITS
jgi:hypothetical protein